MKVDFSREELEEILFTGKCFIHNFDSFYINGFTDDMAKIYNNWVQITYKIETEINKE